MPLAYIKLIDRLNAQYSWPFAKRGGEFKRGDLELAQQNFQAIIAAQLALCGASLAKDEFNTARMIARTVCHASAFVATRLVVVAVLQGTEPEDWQKTPPAQVFQNYPNS
jgi:hypothetical protein